MSDVYRRCGCRDVDGKQYGAACPNMTDPKHGSWGFHLSAGLNPKTGKRQAVRRFGFKTKREAQEERNKAAVKVDKGSYVAPTKQTFADYLDVWLAHRQANGAGLKETTSFNYLRYIHGDIQPSTLGRMMLTDIRRYHVNAFLKELTDAGRARRQ
jgi:hypothetical protein